MIPKLGDVPHRLRCGSRRHCHRYTEAWNPDTGSIVHVKRSNEEHSNIYLCRKDADDHRELKEPP